MTESELLPLLASRPTRTELADRLGLTDNSLIKWLARRRREGWQIVAVWSGQYRYELLKGKP